MSKTMTSRLLAGAAAMAVLAAAGEGLAQQRSFNVPAQPAVDAIPAFARQAGVQIVVPSSQLRGVRTPALSGAQDTRQALRRLIAGTGLEVASDNGSTIVLRRAAARPAPAQPAAQEAPVRPRNRQAAPPPAAEPTPEATTVQDIIVTARRMQERIIDVPVAVSAFTAEQLDERKVEGGSELLRVIPNVNFSKDNFTGYNFSIRGIGAKVLATTADPGVAISFNNTPLLRNRLFEQEYFDVQRLEVLRGPQGTLYGRNATAGVVNLLPNLPELGVFEGDIQAEAGNHGTRRMRGYANIPVGDTLALRFAGAATQRDGFDYNTVTERNVNGRDLWSTRVGVLWEPTSNFRANFLWERFREDDDRARTGKMLCTRGETPETLEWTAPDGTAQTSSVHSYWTSTTLTQGCTPSSLYADEAYGVPDGRGFPLTAAIINFTGVFENPVWTGGGAPPANWGSAAPNGWDGTYLLPLYVDPFGVEGNRQSPDLRTISTGYDPKFSAENDIFQMNLEWDLTPGLTLHSQTLYMEDSYSGFQDFFRTHATGQMYRHETPGIINGLPRTVAPTWAPWIGASSPNVGTVYSMAWSGQGVCGSLPDCGIPSGGVFLDPQLGATDRFMALDLSQAESTQWSQEFRLQSDWDGPFNFNLGANWLKYKTEENYWVFSNVFSMMAVQQNGSSHINSGNFDRYCNLTPQGQTGVDTGTLDPHTCAYIDNTPLADIIAGKGGDGHNYIRSTSISETESWAVFGEGYWTVRDDLRLTLGLRYTDDTKIITPVPSQLLASTPHASKPDATGLVGRGYPRYPQEEMNWGEWTGRAAIDWRPDLSFTNDTLIYASYSRGYKGGGGNPRDRDYNPNLVNVPSLPSRYDPEFVNAYELGMKNSLLDGRLVFNATGFFYDYEGYQVAQLMERQIHNENFDARIWGAEFETAWAPTRNFRLDATLGLLRTRIGDGMESIDVMNRTQGNPDWVVMKPWPGSPSTCIVPADVVGRIIGINDWRRPYHPKTTPNLLGSAQLRTLCPSSQLQGSWVRGSGSQFNYADRWSNTDPWQSEYPLSWDPLTAPNGGRGFAADLAGNELPNAPRVTFNIGASYRFELPQGWDLMVRGDYYRQSDSWMRVYNYAPYDRLKGWGNANMSFTLINPDATLVAHLYVKNVFDDTPLTDGFTGPDDMGNATNVFTLDPRLIGVSVRKSF
ncbi:TonB-dependent receptor domain-containing protein [Brevundimonas diminuta]|uniref:TonB-dependent receptor domain-containing protein n=1 Tax=Brevundimonas diminuta TaxID=293 RepID=UPI0030FAEE78